MICLSIALFSLRRRNVSRSSDVSFGQDMSLLLAVGEMPNQWRKKVHETLQDTDDAQAHYDPFHDFLEERLLDYGPKDKTDNRDDHGGDDRHPDRYSNAKCSFVHKI